MKKIYLLLLCMVLSSPVLFAQIFVTEAGAGAKDGTSWENAYEGTQLQDAINSAAPGQQVWVAKGIYKPTEKLSENVYTTADGTEVATTDDRDNAFILKTGVEIYGGFAGTESAIGDRTDIAITNETILSGDLNNNNTADVGDAYHVVAARDDTDGAVLDGFTIQHGYGDSGDFADIGGTYRMARNLGGAISFFSAKTLTFSNLVIKDNKTTLYGGAIQARSIGDDAKYDFLNVTFENNEGVTRGGAVYSAGANGTNTSSINFVSCIFLNNKTTSSSGNGGGAIIHEHSTLNITDSNFDGNQSDGAFGGAIRLSSGTANIVSSTFQNGYVGNGLAGSDADGRGGAIYNTGSATLNISNSKFKNNRCLTAGAHIYMFSGNATISNTKFEGGIAEGSGGAIYFNGVASRTIDNSIFYNNQSKTTGTGGATIYTASVNSELTITNSTFYANKSASAHGAISFNNTNNVKLNMYNNIFNGNLGGYDFDNETGGTSADVRRGTSAVQTYSNNLFQNAISSSGNRAVVEPYYLDGTNPQPLFASTTEGDYDFLWLIENSFAIDKGDNTLYTNNVSDVATAKDLLGNDRLEGTTIDLGAIEWGVVLPVQISSFTANLVNGRTQLKWSVGTEDNVNRYEVERSQNGTDFTTVATVGANGDSSYNTTDNSPALGINYYRLVTIDNDGTRKAYGQLQTVTVATLALEGVSVYPNPATGGEVNVSLGNAAAGTYGYKVLGTTGSVVQQGSIDYNGTSAVVSVGSLLAGVYVLQFSNGAQAKLIKQ